MREINNLVIHCSDSPDDDIGFIQINEWHRARGWRSPSGIHCGYHFIIRRNGVIEVGRPVNEIGAHVEGHNSDSIGICLVGEKVFSNDQFDALKRIVAALLIQFPGSEIHAHNEFDTAKRQGKTCPNFDIHTIFPVSP